MSQLSFEDTAGLVRNDHPDTSHDAATAILPRTGTQRRKVYDFLVKWGEIGATDLELQGALHMDGNTERPRRVELVRAGLVTDSGRRRNHQGRDMIVWVATR